MTTERPLGASVIGQHLRLTPRQIHYTLREIKTWLNRRNATMRHLPGVGVQIFCSDDQKARLLAELNSQAKFQLILTPGQRQQLLALQLLTLQQPQTLSQFQQDVLVSRATVLKDLENVALWLEGFSLQLARRQHRGCWVAGNEFARRQALTALLWGDTPFEQPLMSVQHTPAIAFTLAHDAHSLPMITQINELLESLNLSKALEQLAWAEVELGGRFTNMAVLQLSLTTAIQMQRIALGEYVGFSNNEIAWLHEQSIWRVANSMAERLWPNLPQPEQQAEVAALAAHLLAGARDEAWHYDLGPDQVFSKLIDTLCQQIASAYNVPELAQDHLLREGLEAHVFPAYVRQRFQLWSTPATSSETLDLEHYVVEDRVARQLADYVAAQTGTLLPEETINDLVLLLRAAFIRARPERSKHVLVVCPSGMATTQLLVARLRARFPRLVNFEVLSMRDLNDQRIAEADLIITTTPLVLSTSVSIDIIQVHPMLKPEDIAALTQWMG